MIKFNHYITLTVLQRAGMGCEGGISFVSSGLEGRVDWLKAVPQTEREKERKKERNKEREKERNEKDIMLSRTSLYFIVLYEQPHFRRMGSVQ